MIFSMDVLAMAAVITRKPSTQTIHSNCLNYTATNEQLSTQSTHENCKRIDGRSTEKTGCSILWIFESIPRGATE